MRVSYRKVNKKEASEAINRVASTEDGQIFLALLEKECGFFENLISMDNPNQTQVLAAQRGIYARIRKYIRPEYLLEAEYRTEIGDDEAAFKKAEKKKRS